MEIKVMLTIMFMLMFMLRSSHCEQCPNATTSYQTNLKTLLDLLTKNAPLNDGFYETSVGHKPDQAFGVLQCRAGISKNDCANCLKHPSGVRGECPNNEEEVLTTFCSMKYSHNKFFGVWSDFTMTRFGDNGLDNPLVYSKGFSMMQDLVSRAPDQPLMYRAGEIDVGAEGKRYGLAQCGRDLSKIGCKNCLLDRLSVSRPYTENRTGWEIVGVGCSLWYSNISHSLIPSTSEVPHDVVSGVQRCHGGTGIINVINMNIGATFMVLLATRVFRFP